MPHRLVTRRGLDKAVPLGSIKPTS
jgi:hypothetical protein